MSKANESFRWAPWLGQAQQFWEQAQSGLNGAAKPWDNSWANSWAGLWPSAGTANAFGSVPNLMTALQEVLNTLTQSAKSPESASRDLFEQINTVLQPLLTQSMLAQQPLTAYWQRVFEDFPGIAGGGIPGLQDGFPGLDVAPLGAAREYLRQGQAYAAESAELPQKLFAYQQVLADFPERLKKHLEADVAALEDAGKTLDSARAVFDFWVDSAEKAFAEIAHSPAYGKAQGELSNLLMQLKLGRQQMLDHALEFAGMPSRRELDTTHRRVTALRRENRALKQALAALAQDVEDLKASRRANKSAPKAAPRSKSSTARKTAEEASA